MEEGTIPPSLLLNGGLKQQTKVIFLPFCGTFGQNDANVT